MPQYFCAKINIKVEYCKENRKNFTFMVIYLLQGLLILWLDLLEKLIIMSLIFSNRG